MRTLLLLAALIPYCALYADSQAKIDIKNTLYRHFMAQQLPTIAPTANLFPAAMGLGAGFFDFLNYSTPRSENTADPAEFGGPVTDVDSSLIQTNFRDAIGITRKNQKAQKNSLPTRLKTIGRHTGVGVLTFILTTESGHYIRQGLKEKRAITIASNAYIAASCASPAMIMAPAFFSITTSPFFALIWLPGVFYATSNRLVHAYDAYTNNKSGAALQHVAIGTAIAGSFLGAAYIDWAEFFRT